MNDYQEVFREFYLGKHGGRKLARAALEPPFPSAAGAW